MALVISEIEGVSLEFCNLPGIIFCMSLVPKGLPEDHHIRQKYDDRSIQVPNENGSLWITVRRDDSQGASVAEAVFASTQRTVQCDTIEVHRDFRLLGIATKLYDLAEEVFDAPVVPSETLSEDAMQFWKKRKFTEEEVKK